MAVFANVIFPKEMPDGNDNTGQEKFPINYKDAIQDLWRKS
jgi:hypothetical protein